MTPAAATAFAVAASFAAGSIPFGPLIAKAVGRVDLRTVGSGNVGATNVGRALGLRWFVAVLLLDAAKGALPVLLLPRALGRPGDEWLAVGCAVAAVLGHVFSPFLGFRGGKGVATAAGAVAAASPLVAGLGAAVFGIVLLLFRFVSLASVCAALALPAIAWAAGSPAVTAFGGIAAVVVLLRHRTNLARIASGSEPRVGGDRQPSGGRP
jgi:glycerol-3-phosphate acyltransferase PlsY